MEKKPRTEIRSFNFKMERSWLLVFFTAQRQGMTIATGT